MIDEMERELLRGARRRRAVGRAWATLAAVAVLGGAVGMCLVEVAVIGAAVDWLARTL